MTQTTQEKSDLWDKYFQGGLNDLFSIYGRLKKQIAELEDNASEEESELGRPLQSTQQRLTELKKILGEDYDD